MSTSADPHPIVVHGHGRVATADHVYADDRLARLCRVLTDHDTRCSVDLVDHGNESGEKRSVRAEFSIDGTVLHAHARGDTVRDAVDQLEATLRQRLEQLDLHDDATTTRRKRP